MRPHCRLRTHYIYLDSKWGRRHFQLSAGRVATIQILARYRGGYPDGRDEPAGSQRIGIEPVAHFSRLCPDAFNAGGLCGREPGV